MKSNLTPVRSHVSPNYAQQTFRARYNGKRLLIRVERFHEHQGKRRVLVVKMHAGLAAAGRTEGWKSSTASVTIQGRVSRYELSTFMRTLAHAAQTHQWTDAELDLARELNAICRNLYSA